MNGPGIIKGIGVDLVDLADFHRQCEAFGLESIEQNAFITRVFTEAEQAQAKERLHPLEYLAGRFAVKEAVTKALSPLVQPWEYDMRIVESLDRPDGSPYVTGKAPLDYVMSKAGISQILISLTNESGFVLAFAVAQ